MEIRAATPLDLLKILITRRRQRVLRLNPPYTLVQPDPLLRDLLRSQIPLRPQDNFIFACVGPGDGQNPKSEEVLGYVQARCRWRRRDEWNITTLGTIEKSPDRVWGALLDEVCRAAGERGVVRVFAKIPSDEDRVALFRRVGFTHYTNEQIWGNLYFAPSGVQINEQSRKPLRRQTNRDAWDLLQLYLAVTPPVVQRAEALTSRQWYVSGMLDSALFQGLREHSYVWQDESRTPALGGYVRVLTGPRGHWITLLFRPDEANRSIWPGALDYVLWKASRFGNKPVYCAVREYQSEVGGLLESKGFHLLSEQALLVKYLAEPLRDRQPALVPFLVRQKGEMVATDFPSS